MSGPAIAIVDDDPMNVVLLADLLIVHGYRVSCWNGGDAFLRSLDDEVPDLVLLDIQMPGKSGHDVLLEMRGRADCARAKVVALTASLMPAQVDRVAAEGFDGYHGKPVAQDRLLEQIRALVGAGASAPGAHQ